MYVQLKTYVFYTRHLESHHYIQSNTFRYYGDTWSDLDSSHTFHYTCHHMFQGHTLTNTQFRFHIFIFATRNKYDISTYNTFF